MDIGDCVYIDKESIINAVSIGSNVWIGKNCVFGKGTVIKDNARILDNSILAPDTVVPPFTVFGGSPATYLGDLPESAAITHAELAKNYYKNFIAV